jgi:hypothetical protein
MSGDPLTDGTTVPAPPRLRVALAALGACALLLLSSVVGALGGAGNLAGATGDFAPSATALADIPADMLVLYRRAGLEYRIDWAVLAAIGSIESDHGRSQAPGVHSGLNFAGCCAGPMQFDVTDEGGNTWAAYGVDGNGDGIANVYEPADAVLAAARYLRGNGAPADYRRAIFAYNQAHWYVRDILALAVRYHVALASTQVEALDVRVENVLSNPRIVLTPVQRSDLARGLIDSRIVALLAWVGSRHAIVVTSLRSDHAYLTKDGNPSNHAFGRAVDIGSVDGERCTGARSGACGVLAVHLARIVGVLHPTELIYCFDPDGPASADGIARADHCDHVHVGYDS